MEITPPDSYHNEPKKRRKQIKSCMFCRKRKLKCDKAKPMCGQCKERKLPDCLYTDFNFPVNSMKDLFDNTPNLELMERIKLLEQEVDELRRQQQLPSRQSINTNVSNNNISNSNNIQDTIFKHETIMVREMGNPLWNFRIQKISQGKSLIFGPTSWKTSIYLESEPVREKHFDLWGEIISNQKIWNQEHGITTKEFSVLESSIANDLTVMESMCQELPRYEEIKTCLADYFTSPLRELLEIMPEKTIVSVFEQHFIAGGAFDPKTGIKQSIKFSIREPQDYFRVGVIVSIICIQKFPQQIPASIEKFFTFLSGVPLSSVNSIDKAYFFAFQYIYRIYHCPNANWDGSEVADLVALLCQSCLNLGLDDMDRWCKDEGGEQGEEQKDVNGNSYDDEVKSLTLLWNFTLFADVCVSFDMGKPLFISNNHFDHTRYFRNVLTDKSVGPKKCRRDRLMKNFLKVGRQCINKVNDLMEPVDLISLTTELLEFIESSFLPIKYYTSIGLIGAVDIWDIMILSPTLGMLLNFFDMNKSFLKNISFYNKNGISKIIFVSVSACVTTLQVMYARDSYVKRKTDDNYLKPNLNLCLLLLNTLSIRTLAEMYGLMIEKLMLLEKGNIRLPEDDGANDRAINNVDMYIPNDCYYPVLGTVQKFLSALDPLFDPILQDFHREISKSFALSSLFKFERLSRSMFDNVLKSRTLIQQQWDERGYDLDNLSEKNMEDFLDDIWSVYEKQNPD
ncbi:Pdr8p NDAI_0I02190 [Naumovozyma dairenensis CBS 421]|uniref:Zn(2)-C6 fungal-type domain-containing protein n=1 Tax=Naumovozyma dairenensis (strain ATCC 10597 / BCRC 20456 / CBS 421 / NBRC 0211 / NRRL Y-12639) TaxID=1071378 RepID=G0WG77_NAUDC|nr:hypothetical protein NDAI_0I02190 [Naumovozyma dairenensis CBS 421]CCD26788.1 hypothetical protein NDAI_0I02190 [Naumovozyma dairenensis CBS 421]